MDCEESLPLLSDYHAGELDEAARDGVRDHLGCCPPCDGIYHDVETIVVSASSLREEEGISFPDENAIWQRMQFN
ncbi:MAG: putative zinc-finger [Pyrinomonadaceae bacterium]|jgi:predicted anti-sigma-YlaC factor YlaD|nr:putative zinc-finger [Pyrinomonadaceae bacterium]MDX6270793.1 putative zinc-finger [Acidobacteriota bacterium]